LRSADTEPFNRPMLNLAISRSLPGMEDRETSVQPTAILAFSRPHWPSRPDIVMEPTADAAIWTPGVVPEGNLLSGRLSQSPTPQWRSVDMQM
jgi:hypothetical protein